MFVVAWREWFGNYRRCLVVCAVLASAIDTEAEAQTATLEGTVQDGSAGVIASGAVNLREQDTNQSRTALTDGQGIFRFTGVTPGAYVVGVTYDRFESYAHAGVTLAIGQTVRLNVVLRPVGVIESIAVRAQPPPLDPRQTSVATTIDTGRIEELPVRSRNYLEFALLAPGVTLSGTQTEPGVLSSTLSDSGFSLGGLRPRSNTLAIDGLDNNDEFTGETRTELSLESVREFQVGNNGWAVVTGGGSVGGINVVTKSGANTLHGDVFLFGQFGVCDASPKLESRPSVADFGSAYMGSNTHDQRYLELGDTVGHARGSHVLKAGFNARHVVVTGTTTDGIYGCRDRSVQRAESYERHPGEYRLRAASGITPIVRSSD
jgi:Carboxypeptidase regulatory-like domain